MIKTPRLKPSIIALKDWFLQEQRDLSFRKNASVYQVWISETMLQQTTVTAVVPYYERFMTHFPTIKDLALASLESVLELWSGLGYYSRAKNLHRCAQIVYKEHGGVLPQTRKELLTLPGIGDYTAGAILSFGYGQKETLVDTNIARVLSRLRANPSLAYNKKRLWKTASLVLSYACCYMEPKTYNTAIMELGALVCKHSKADCPFCPLMSTCKTVRLGLDPLTIPSPKPKKQKVLVNETSYSYIIEHLGVYYLLVMKDPSKKWLKDLWDLPTQALIPKIDNHRQFEISYTITHHNIKRTVKVYHLSYEIMRDLKKDNIKWISYFNAQEIESLAASSALKKTIKRLKNLE